MDTNIPGKRVMIIAGEASGDLHGANLARELKKLDSTLELSGIGGACMAGAGVRLIRDIANLAVMGIVEVLKGLQDIRSAMKSLEAEFKTISPDLLILLDYPGFNLELARRAKKYRIPVLYYISPKIWAWREGRIRQIKKYVDRMAVILPFEKKFYQTHGVVVDFVGNPLLDEVSADSAPAEFRSSQGIAPGTTVIGIMPGSRRQEIAKLLPLFLQAALILKRKIDKCVFLLPLASTLKEEEVRQYTDRFNSLLDIRIITDLRYEAMAACDASMAASGTLTMELAILGVPMVVCYRVAMLSYLLARPFIRVKYVSLVNLVAEGKVVPELLQHAANPENITQELLPLLLDHEAAEAMRQELVRVRSRLGTPGASSRTARLAVEMLAAGG